MTETLILEKNENGRVSFWRADFEGATAKVSWGLVGGKTQVQEKTWTEGKNAGKANATSPDEQCRRDVVSKAQKKLADGYAIKLDSGDVVERYKTGLVRDVAFDVPEPMLAKVYDDHAKKLSGVAVVMTQPKKDGNRCLVNVATGAMYSRKRKEIKSLPGLGEAVAAAARVAGVKGDWIDGELYSDELTFNEIQSAVRSDEPVEHNEMVSFHVFDVISGEQQLARAQSLEAMDGIYARVRVVPYRLVPIDGLTPVGVRAKLMAVHDEYVADGDEGLMVRFIDAKYETKRTDRLLKLKVFDDAEFKVIGWECEKNAPDRMGAAICEINGEEFRAVPKMSKADKAALWAVRDEYVGKLATVRFQGYDERTGKPRFPRIIGFRAEGDV